MSEPGDRGLLQLMAQLGAGNAADDTRSLEAICFSNLVESALPSQRRKMRDLELVRLASILAPCGTVRSRALAVRTEMARYERSAWSMDRARGPSEGADAKRIALFSIATLGGAPQLRALQTILRRVQSGGSQLHTKAA